MKRPKTHDYEPVEIEYGGKKYSGSYYVERGMVTVTTLDYGSKSTQVGGSPPALLARIMLRELVSH